MFGIIKDIEMYNDSGTGLGLTICKKLVNCMGGSIDFESKIGIGTKFIFTIEAQINLEEDGSVLNTSRRRFQPIMNDFHVHASPFK
jgi:K+-sensing histidine kinase KdpD